eukprot:773770_1
MGNSSTTSRNESCASYTWKIPSLTEHKIYHLISGYVREFDDHVSVPVDIIGVFMAFFNDNHQIEKIKKAKPGDSFKSNIFGVDKFRFEIELCPNGEAHQPQQPQETYEAGLFTLFLNLLSIPPPISKLSLKYDTSFIELNIRNTDELEFSRDITSYRWSEKLHIRECQALTTFTFKIEVKGIKLFYVNDKDNEHKSDERTEIINTNSVTISDHLSISLPKGYYTWKLHDIETIKSIRSLNKDECIESNLFELASIKWIMKLYKTEDEECNFCVCIASLSPRITTLFVSYKIMFYERDIVQGGCIEFKDNAITFWPSKLSNMKGIAEMEHVTIRMEVTVLDAFDKDDSQIENLYALHCSSLNTKTGRYVWKITDSDLLDKVKNAAVNDKFISDCFEYNSCKYCLSLFPNGYGIDKEDPNDENNVAVMLNLLSTPTDIHIMTLCFELIIHETNNRGTNYAQFLFESFWGWQQKNVVLNQPHIQSITVEVIIHETNNRGTNYAQFLFESFWGWQQKNVVLNQPHIQSITVEAIIHIIDVFNEDGVSINKKYVEGIPRHTDTKIASSFPGKYTWSIKEKATIDRIRKAEEGTVFISKVFELFHLKFVMEFYPISHKTDTQTEDVSALYISLLSMPSRVYSISLGYTLRLKETNTEDSNFVVFQDSSTSIGWSRHVAPDAQVVRTIDSLTFEVELDLLDIYDQDGHFIVNQFVDAEHTHDEVQFGKEIDISLARHEWMIQDTHMIKKLRKASHSEFFRSPLFCLQGFKFFMQITPNGANPSDIGNFGCFLYIASLPPHVWKITLYYELALLQTNTIDCYATVATHKRTTCGWFRNLKFKDIDNINEFTFSLKVGIIDVLDQEG